MVTWYADCATVVRDPRLIHLPPDMLAFVGLPDWAEHPALRLLFTSMLLRNHPTTPGCPSRLDGSPPGAQL